ncbi:unnamed protein product [Brachionus calyciflorus]|uniref:PiggyBac transposable element-derived protein domain-containing protein n=1 Tax=Brachionus calyciflorus TaxID=104777 RepID=A0A813VJF8_9BILA|nr:unnamed protein product [Brachionus calyciflorus]
MAIDSDDSGYLYTLNKSAHDQADSSDCSESSKSFESSNESEIDSESVSSDSSFDQNSSETESLSEDDSKLIHWFKQNISLCHVPCYYSQKANPTFNKKSHPIDYFYELFDIEFFNRIRIASNNYASKKMEKKALKIKL